MIGRLACCVPFCRRTTGRTEFREWICGDHWRLIDKAKRRVYGRLGKRWRRYRCDDGWANLSEVERADRIWRRLKAQATERAAGIT